MFEAFKLVKISIQSLEGKNNVKLHDEKWIASAIDRRLFRNMRIDPSGDSNNDELQRRNEIRTVARFREKSAYLRG